MSDVQVLGIRHHGPGSARSVERVLDTTRPQAVLVELPSDAAPLLGYVGRDDLVPPVALAATVVDHPSRGAFWPLASFSPEWVAMRWAHRHGAEVRPVDLAAAHVLAADDDPELPLGLTAGPARPLDPIAALAQAAGDDDPERWWEDLVEHRGDGEPVFGAVGEAMAAVREGWAPEGIEARREAAMRRGIRRAQRDGFERIAVVCGAWHAPALSVPLPSAASDAALVRGLPRTKVAFAWVPWTHRRLAASTGYGAGVASPGWYQHVFANPGPEGVVRWFVGAARHLRREGLDTSPDHLIAGARLATSLAALRDRPRPGLDEVLDAATAVFADGRDVPLRLVRDRLVVGDAIGAVPLDAPMVPLARDLLREQRQCRLRPTPEARRVELDLRTSAGRARSRLLHRLDALEVPWGRLVEGRGSSGTFRETWHLVWEPELAVVLVERAGLGSTVETAATARLAERAQGTTSLAGLVRLIRTALAAELRTAVDELLAELARRAARDPAVVDLLDALGPLAETSRYGDVRDTEADLLRAVVDGIVWRTLAGLETACVALDPAEAAAMAERLTAAQAALSLLDHPVRRSRWPAVMTRVTSRRGVPGLVQGRAARLLHDAGAWDSTTLSARFTRALSPGTPPADGAGFVEGFLAGSGTALVHDHELFSLVDTWLATLPPDGFADVLPLLRRTFGGFEPAERHLLGELVSGGSRPSTVEFGPLDPDRAARVLVTVRTMLGLAP